jgi:hypothetical protein
MSLPFGSIDGNSLEVRFSTADFSVATVIGGVREHIDMFEEMAVSFLGIATDVPEGNQPVFKPINIIAYFEYTGAGDAEGVLTRIYKALWKGVVMNFPDEIEWSEAKENYSEFIIAQAEMLRANRND